MADDPNEFTTITELDRELARARIKSRARRLKARRKAIYSVTLDEPTIEKALQIAAEAGAENNLSAGLREAVRRVVLKPSDFD